MFGRRLAFRKDFIAIALRFPFADASPLRTITLQATTPTPGTVAGC